MHACPGTSQTDQARAATEMTAADLGQRLPAPQTHDELDELGRAFNDLLCRLQDAFARLHEAYDKQRQFAGDASHQLRTPLAGLLSQVQVSLRPRPLSRRIPTGSREGSFRGCPTSQDRRIALVTGQARRRGGRGRSD